jgi:hypothetical protein
VPLVAQWQTLTSITVIKVQALFKYYFFLRLRAFLVVIFSHHISNLNFRKDTFSNATSYFYLKLPPFSSDGPCKTTTHVLELVMTTRVNPKIKQLTPFIKNEPRNSKC